VQGIACEDRDRQYRERDDADLMGGSRRSNGKPNPVTLVATVLARNKAVQPLSRFLVSSPYMTTNPEPIPTKLTRMCTKVNVEGDILHIMMHLLISTAPV
jgi:hypothetical protein